MSVGAAELDATDPLAFARSLFVPGGDVVAYLDGNSLGRPLAAAPDAKFDGDTAALGKLLFTQYTLPFEIVSVLLLVAMVGVIFLSKKDLK